MYICKECNYMTKIKCNFDKHLKTKKHMNNISNSATQNNQFKQTYTFEPKIAQFDTNLAQNCPISAQNSPKLPNLAQSAQFFSEQEKNYNFIENETKFVCDYCDRGFKRVYHLKRHQKICKNKSQDLIYKKLYEDALNEKAKSEENKDKIISQLTEQLERVIDKVGNTHITQNNIILNCYGNENTDYITDKFKLDLVKLPYTMIPKLIKEVHFSQNCPANNNIYIPNKKEPYVKVYANNKWILKDRTKTINELIDKNYNMLDVYYQEKGVNHMEEDQKNRYLEFQVQKENNNDDLIKDVKKNVEIILMNKN